MHAGTTIFAQTMDLLPWRRFQTCVTRYQGDYKVQTFKCAEHFRVMAFAQLTYRESLRDIETCLRVMGSRLYHMGIRSTVSRNNLSHANENRDWRIYADFTQILIDRAKALYANEQLGLDLESTVYALDSTTIDLCRNLFPWARFRKTKSAIKLHTLMNLRGSIPEFIHISDGKMHDVNILDLLVPTPGAFYIMDRAYLDFERLYNLHHERAFFYQPCQKQFQVQAPLFTRGGEVHGCSVRSDNCFNDSLSSKKISRTFTTDSILRYAKAEAPCLSYEQFRVACGDNSNIVQIPLAH